MPGYEVGCIFDPLTDKPLLIAPGAYGGSAPVAVDTVAIGRNWNSDLKVANIVNEYAFGPENITVPVGTTVTFSNQGDVAHTASSETGVFDSGLLSNGESYTFTFDTPGTYGYFCAPHPWMLGQVIVN